MSLVLIFTPDEQVGQIFRLELSEAGYDVQIIPHAPDEVRTARGFIDMDAFPHAAVREADVAFSRYAPINDMDTRLPLPFAMGAARACLDRQSSDMRILRLTEHGVDFQGRTIHLTETEHALLSALIDAGGATVPREALLACMRGGTESAVNVYIHYLRKKLEQGERILLSERGGGYRIDPRFLT